METLELLQMIGNEICEGCGPDADCGEDPKDCSRIADAASWLVDWVAFQQSYTADPKSCPLYVDYRKSCKALKDRDAELGR